MNNLKDSYQLIISSVLLDLDKRKRRERGGAEGEEDPQTNRATPGAAGAWVGGETHREAAV